MMVEHCEMISYRLISSSKWMFLDEFKTFFEDIQSSLHVNTFILDSRHILMYDTCLYLLH